MHYLLKLTIIYINIQTFYVHYLLKLTIICINIQTFYIHYLLKLTIIYNKNCNKRTIPVTSLLPVPLYLFSDDGITNIWCTGSRLKGKSNEILLCNKETMEGHLILAYSDIPVRE